MFGSAGIKDKELGGRNLRDWERVQPKATRVCGSLKMSSLVAVWRR